MIDNTCSWEEIASLPPLSPPQKSQLESSSLSEPRDAECSVIYGHHHFLNKESFPHFDYAFESKNSKDQFLCSPESICSNGDLQVGTNLKEKLSPFSSEKSLMAEANFKVGRYSVEERKERIDRYRAKRTRRNFNKTIKYACRKTLADGRQRIRGRFVRNDDVGEILEASLFQRCEDKYYDLWVESKIDDGYLSCCTLCCVKLSEA